MAYKRQYNASKVPSIRSHMVHADFQTHKLGYIENVNLLQIIHYIKKDGDWNEHKLLVPHHPHPPLYLGYHTYDTRDNLPQPSTNPLTLLTHLQKYRVHLDINFLPLVSGASPPINF
jgi:hypothetical protein